MAPGRRIKRGMSTVFRLYSKGCEYALRALMCAGPEGRFQAKDVCEQAGIPEPFTRKILQALVQGGFLRAVRGPGGGYELTSPPDEISLLAVINAIDGAETFDGCVMGLDECGDEHPCPFHTVWAEVKERMIEQLEAHSLQDLADIEQDERDRAANAPAARKKRKKRTS